MRVVDSALPELLEKDVRAWGTGRGGCVILDTGGVVASTGDLEESLPWASVTKIIAALAVLDVVQDGRLALDEPVGPAGSTVRHLLSHASGLAFDESRTLSEPGRRRIYSNVGIDLVVERAVTAVGAPDSAALLRDRVLEPLGMTRTIVVGPPAHGARGPLADLVRLASELLTPSGLRHEVHADLVTPAFPGLAGVLPGYGRQDPNDWGHGVELHGHKAPHWMPDQIGPSAFGHFGQAGSFLWVDPDRGLASVALTGTDFGPWAVESWSRGSTRWVAQWDREHAR